MERIGVLGGSFDPPHRGHLRIAAAAQSQLRLDRVIWVPAGEPPHKSHQIAAHHRVAMTGLVVEGHPRFELSRIDVERTGPHYTADLLALLRDQTGCCAAYWFLVGQDSLRDLADWYQPGRILELCRLAVYPRSGDPVDWQSLERVVPTVRHHVDRLSGRAIDLSSSFVRQQAQAGKPIDKWVLPAVLAYIAEHRLYRPETSPSVPHEPVGVDPLVAPQP